MSGTTIQTLGGLTIRRDGQTLALPASKRTRALLGYLALTSRPQRRDRLCELFWEIPDDPRGALRWSLSKIRPLVNEPKTQRLLADRERVTLDTADVAIDVRGLALAVERPSLSVEALQRLAEALGQTLLEGDELPDQPLYQDWLLGERREVELLRSRVFKRLAQHADLTPDRAIEWSRAWLALEPFSPEAATQLLTQLAQLGQDEERLVLSRQFTERFRSAGIAWSAETRTSATGDRGVGNVAPKGRRLLNRQNIRFCTADDGVRIAYASLGSGSPIVKAANWLSHLELDWDAPIWSPLFRELAREHQFVRYDERGNGLSDWDVSDISFSAFINDLETVVDASAVERFALLGISQGAAVSIEYAVRHPERVSHLILFGAYAAGWRIDATDAVIQEREAVMTLTATGWGQDNPAYRQIFSSTFLPSATGEELTWFNEFQRRTTSPENAVRFLSAFGDIDVRHRLQEVRVPTLVIHALGDRRIPVSAGRDIAAAIPDAQFLGLDSDGHLLLGREPASHVFIDAVRAFVA